MKIYLSQDAAAKALGSEAVAEAIRTEAAKAGIEMTLVRTGSRGMIWLEPLLEVETPEGRMAYGPMTPADVAGVLAGKSRKALGRTEDVP